MMIIDSHTHVDLVEAWGWMDPPETILDLMPRPVSIRQSS